MFIGKKQVRFNRYPIHHYYPNYVTDNAIYWWNQNDLNSFKKSCINEILYLLQKFHISLFSAKHILYQPIKNNIKSQISFDNISDITNDDYVDYDYHDDDDDDSFQTMIDNDLTWKSVDTNVTWKTIYTLK